MKFDLKSRLLQNGLSARAPGFGGFNFSRRIAGKYGIFRKSGRLPSLIFLRLSGVRAKNKNFVHRVSISNYLKFQFGFYFEFIRQLIKTPDNHQLQKLYNFINSKNEGYLPQADNRLIRVTKISGENASRVLPHILFAPLKVVSGFFGQSWRGVDFKRKSLKLHIGQSGGVVNDFQQRNGLTFFNNFATYQGDLIFPHKHFSSGYPAQDDKKTIEPLPSGIKASREEVSSGSARAIMNVKPPEGTNAFQKELTTVSNIDYEHIPEFGNAGKNFLPTRSYLIIQPVRMVTYSANVTISHLQRMAGMPGIWIFGSQLYQTGYPFASGKQPEEKHSFPAKIMNFHSAVKDAVSAKQLYPQNRATMDISYEHNPQESGTGGNLLFYRNTPQPAAVGYSRMEKQQPTSNPEISHSLRQGASLTGSHLITRPVNMTLIYSNIYSNPRIRGYLKRTPDIEAVPEHRIIQAHIPGSRNYVKEGGFSEPPPDRMNGLTAPDKVFRQGLAKNVTSRENIHLEKIQSLEPTLPGTGGHPAPDVSHRSMTETGTGYKTLPDSHLVNRHLKMVTSNTVNFSNLKTTPNIRNKLSKSNPVIHHFVPVAQPSNNENQSVELPHIKAERTLAGIRDMTGKSTESFPQERTIANTRYENIIREYENTRRKNTIRTHRGIILKPAEDQFSDMVFSRQGIDLKYGIPTDMTTPVEISTGNLAYNPTAELILKKPVVQKTGIIQENKEQAEKTTPRNINDTLIRESFKEKSLHEINRIADTVYRMIEKRISIEKDRRGLS
jgi:hypothetical protein